MTDATQQNDAAFTSVSAFLESKVNLQIGRTGEKAKFQGQQVTIDLAGLPHASVIFALQYGLKQYIADGTAGSEDQAGYDLGIRLRLEKLAEGDFSRKAGERGPRADTAEGRAKKMAIAAIRAKLVAAGQKAEAKAIAEAAGKMVEAQPVWLERAKKALAEEAKLADATDIGDVLEGLLGLTED